MCEHEHVSDTRYTIISADGHCGADIPAYKPYLASKWHDEFDAWAAAFDNPFVDLTKPGADRNWDTTIRLADLDADGIAGEVLFPNTVPPFFPSGNLLAGPPSAAEYERRWAGLQAHNRWLADFCSHAPDRWAGIPQILVNDVDDAVAEIRWAKDAGLRGGILLPGIAPDSGLPPIYDPVYDPIWRVCEELDVTITQHGGTGLPDFGTGPAGKAILLIELPIFSHRALWHLMFSGVFDRHPTLRFVMTEQGTGWIPGALRSLDWFQRRMLIENAAEYLFGGEVATKMTLTPTEYFHRNCYVGASFIRPIEAALRHEVGVDRIMWGTDYPHSEGTFPYTTEALRASLSDATETEMRSMLATTAAEVYGFDLAAMDEIGRRIGPRADDVAVPLAPPDYPTDTTCNAFDPDAVVRSW